MKPAPFEPNLTIPEREEIFKMGLDVLDETGLLEDHEYLSSDIFNCKKLTSTKKPVKIRGVEHLFDLVGKKPLIDIQP